MIISSCLGVLIYDGQTNRQTDVCDCRVAFATEKFLLVQSTTCKHTRDIPRAEQLGEFECEEDDSDGDKEGVHVVLQDVHVQFVHPRPVRLREPCFGQVLNLRGHGW